MTRTLALTALIAITMLSGCRFFEGAAAHERAVARAAGHELTVEEVASLIARNPRLPKDPGVVQAVADLWIDYVILANAIAKDPTLESVDVSALIQAAMDQEVVWQLRDEVIDADTSFTDEELRQAFLDERPGMKIRARHILLQPATVTPSGIEAVRSQAEELRDRARAGEDFAALARRYSHDDETRARGGDLGVFGRREMVGEFEDVAFALEVGQVSDVVETEHGLHIIKMEEHILPEFDEPLKEVIRTRLKRSNLLDAEEEYFEDFMQKANIQLSESAPEIFRQLARRPGQQLSSRAASRRLATYEGGRFTARDLQDWLQRARPSRRQHFSTAGDEELKTSLQEVVINHMLIEKAYGRGYQVTPEERDSLEYNARRRLVSAAAAADLQEIEPQEGETKADAIERRVMALLESIITGEPRYVDIHPLIAFSMREQYGPRVFERTFPDVLGLAETLQPPPLPEGFGGTQPPF